MKEMPVNVEWSEFLAIEQLAYMAHDQYSLDIAACEAGLREILGACRADAMKRFAAEEPTVFVFKAVERIPRTLRLSIEAGEHSQ